MEASSTPGMSERMTSTFPVFFVVTTFRWASTSHHLVSRRDDPDPILAKGTNGLEAASENRWQPSIEHWKSSRGGVESRESTLEQGGRLKEDG